MFIALLQVLARRALLRYFLHEIGLARKGRPSIFVSTGSSEDLSEARFDSPRDRLLTLRPDVAFHLFTSHTPCGDASIFPKDDKTNDDLKSSSVKRSSTDDDAVGLNVKKRKIDDKVDDIHRTGAKCLNHEARQDTRLPGSGYHTIGAVRTKPGRGDRTLSVSCSDKLLRWNLTGVQVSEI